MSLLDAFARQARRPRGWLGGLAGLALGRANRQANAWAISLLEIGPDDHVLEVGFGTGHAIAALARMTPRGRVCGTDFSEVMVQQARRRNATAINSGQVDLRQGDVAALPFGEEAFDKLLAVNVFYFLSDPAAALKEWRRVLKPGGRLVLYLTDKENRMAKRMVRTGLFTFYNCEEMTHLLTQAGFRHVRMEAKMLWSGPAFCAIARM